MAVSDGYEERSRKRFEWETEGEWRSHECELRLMNWEGRRKRNAVMFYVLNCKEKSCKRTLCAHHASNVK